MDAREACATHTLFETEDADAPDAIKDRNGEVVLGLCRVCGRGEVQLLEPCTALREEPQGLNPADVGAVQGGG